nr:hypothetical protein [Plasmopara viticola lesion associated mononegaambi virus 8]
MAFEPFQFGKNTTSAEPEEHVDDLELPPDVEVNYDEMAKVISDIDTTKNNEMPLSERDETVGPTPTTPRPMLPPSKDSEAPMVYSYPTELKRPEDRGQETSDDPDDDVMSMNTDINRHERTLSLVSTQIAEMSKKVNLLPDLDSKLRALSTRNNELESKFTKVSQDMENLRKSFNMYQSSTANKIADVERRAAEKQLSVSAVASDDIIPPSEVHETRQSVPSTNRQPETLSASAVAPVPAKKKAVVHDW